MCSHKLLPHSTNVNNRIQKMRFSCADASPAVEWTKKQTHAIIRPEFLRMHKEVQEKKTLTGQMLMTRCD